MLMKFSSYGKETLSPKTLSPKTTPACLGRIPPTERRQAPTLYNQGVDCTTHAWSFSIVRLELICY